MSDIISVKYVAQYLESAQMVVNHNHQRITKRSSFSSFREALFKFKKHLCKDHGVSQTYQVC